MTGKKAVPWAAIKKRYLLGETPKALAEIYGLTAKQVSDKAHLDGWTRKKSEILEKIESQAESTLEELLGLYLGLALDTGKEIKKARETGLIGLTIQDGEGYSSKFADNDQSAGHKYALETMKHRHKKELAALGLPPTPEGEQKPGGLIGGVNLDDI